MKYKATEKFKELGTENSYHQLSIETFYKLRAGAVVDIKLDNNNQYLIKDNYIEKAEETKSSKFEIDDK